MISIQYFTRVNEIVTWSPGVRNILFLLPNPQSLPSPYKEPPSCTFHSQEKKGARGAADLHRITGALGGEKSCSNPSTALQQSQGGADYSRASLCQAQYGSVSLSPLNGPIVPSRGTAPAGGGTGRSFCSSESRESRASPWMSWDLRKGV